MAGCSGSSRRLVIRSVPANVLQINPACKVDRHAGFGAADADAGALAGGAGAAAAATCVAGFRVGADQASAGYLLSTGAIVRKLTAIFDAMAATTAPYASDTSFGC